MGAETMKWGRYIAHLSFLLVIGDFLFCATYVSAQSTAFAVINGKVVSCSDALKFRDGRLAQETIVFLDAYDDDKATRQKLVRDKWHKKIQALDNAWAAAAPAQRNAIYANSISLVLSLVGSYAGERVISKAGISASEKQAAQILIDRGAALTGMLTTAGLGAEVNPSDVIGLPVSVIGALGTPLIAEAALAYGVGNGLIGLGAAGYDYYLENKAYKTQLEALKDSLDKLIDKSLDLKLADFNRVKNEIDTKCRT